jgi:hypothetical protein
MKPLTIVLIPPRVAKTAPLGRPIIATYDPDSSTLKDQDGSSLLPSVFPMLRNAEKVPDDALEILITVDNYKRLFELLPVDISATPFYLKGSDQFPEENLPHLTFMIYHQLISNPRTPLIPYFSYRIKSHLEKFTLGIESQYDWSEPLKSADDAIEFAFFLMAVQIVTGRIVIMVCDPELGPPKLPEALNPIKRYNNDDFVKDITPRPPKSRLLELPPERKLILPPK